MLKLTRKLNQRTELIVNGKSQGFVVVTAVCGKNVQLGFEMPKEVQVVREEAKERRAA